MLGNTNRSGAGGEKKQGVSKSWRAAVAGAGVGSVLPCFSFHAPVSVHARAFPHKENRQKEERAAEKQQPLQDPSAPLSSFLCLLQLCSQSLFYLRL